MNDLSSVLHWGGVRIMGDAKLTITKEDWSKVRSPGRARRRRRMGHRQNVQYLELPDPHIYRLPGGALLAHPTVVDQIRKALA